MSEYGNLVIEESIITNGKVAVVFSCLFLSSQILLLQGIQTPLSSVVDLVESNEFQRIKASTDVLDDLALPRFYLGFVICSASDIVEVIMKTNCCKFSFWSILFRVGLAKGDWSLLLLLRRTLLRPPHPRLIQSDPSE